MFAVIFKATVSKLDDQYSAMAAELRKLAFEKYNCRDFIAVTEGAKEVAISYWDSEADILAWKQDALHRVAQQTGAERWYLNYQVEVLELKHSYSAG